jgi:hypothetical protein
MQAKIETVSTEEATPKKLTYQDKLVLYERWQKSGLTKTAFAIAEKIEPKILYSWLSYVERHQRSILEKTTASTLKSSNSSAWVPIELKKPELTITQEERLAEVKITVNQKISLIVKLKEAQLESLIIRSLQDGISVNEQ